MLTSIIITITVDVCWIASLAAATVSLEPFLSSARKLATAASLKLLSVTQQTNSA